MEMKKRSFVYDPKTYGKNYELTKEQLSSINADDFFSKMLNTFTKIMKLLQERQKRI